MAPTGVERKLTAILCADVAGYSRLMAEDEEATLRALQACRQQIDRLVEQHQGRIFGTAGDSIVAEFPSAVEAVRCGLEVQRAVEALGEPSAEDRRMLFRIGVNLGDVMVEGSDLKGDGVNVAARLQTLADPGGMCISASVFDLVDGKLPVAWSALGEQRLKNIPRPVRAYRLGGGRPAQPSRRSVLRRRPLLLAGAILALLLAGVGAYLAWPTTGSRAPGSGRPVLAVLPFLNLSGDPAQDYFSDGITEDIIAALGRFSDLSVIGYQAVRQFKGKALAAGELARELGVRYALQGSVRRDGSLIRVTAQLSDAQTARHLWSHRYDDELKDVFDVQDKITTSVAAALQAKLIGAETERALAKGPDNLDAYDYVLRGRERLAAGTEEANSEARSLLDKAIGLDPTYASAYVALGTTWLYDAVSGWTEFRDDALQKAEEAALKAIALDDSSAAAHALLGNVYLNQARFDLALQQCERAIALNPSDANSYATKGDALVFTGHPQQAIAAFDTALQLNPGTVWADHLNTVGWSYYLAGRYDDAARVFESGATRPTLDYAVAAGLAASYAQQERPAEAARAAKAVLQTWPFFEAETFAIQFSGADSQARIVAGLRKAGLK
ncbi:MAG: adenylate/guanylate cyclase domain-containing protein [Dongiaceae bacterium]